MLKISLPTYFGSVTVILTPYVGHFIYERP